MQLQKLTALKVKNTAKAGLYCDGGGLYLRVATGGSKQWCYRYMMDSKPHFMGLGSVNTLSLAEAREKARDCRKLILNGQDPIQTMGRNARKVQRIESAAGSISFDECAKQYIEAHRSGWRNPKHVNQWGNTLQAYAFPVFGKLSVSQLDTNHVLKAIQPIWSTKPETANRVRGRVELILDWAKVRGFRAGENPARWKGHLDKLLPPRSKVSKVKHHEALPYAQIPSFMRKLRTEVGVSPKALEFVILTACRVSEAVKAEWPEIDFKAKIWVIPSSRTKSGREHRVPLTDSAIKILKAQQKEATGEFIFPGWTAGSSLTDAACLRLLDKMGYGEYTTHGFRSSFKDWAAELTQFPEDLSEAALAHVIKDKTQKAYQRGDMLQRRAEMMEAWARYCSSPKTTAKVVSIGKRKAR